MDDTEATVVAADAAPMPEADTGPTPPDAVEETPRGAIDRAFESFDQQDSEPAAPEAKPEAKQPEAVETDEPKADGDRERNPDGTFKAKEAAPEAVKVEDGTETAKTAETDATGFTEAPGRFSADAKAVWKDAPLPVRAEIHRMQEELGNGIEHYKAQVEEFAEFKPFAEQLKQTGQKFTDVVGYYTGIEDMLQRDPMQGLDTICRNMGTDLQSVAAQVLNQTPDQASQQHNATIYELRQEINGLKQQLGGVTETMTTQTQKALMSDIDAFAAKNPRFNEVADDVAFFLTSGRATDLQSAYDLAERLNPAPQAPAPAVIPDAAHTRTDDAAQTRNKGNLSVTGAPGSGSNPAARKTPKSARDAVDNAFATMGMG